MKNIIVFLDTGVLVNRLAKENDPNTGEELWSNESTIYHLLICMFFVLLFFTALTFLEGEKFSSPKRCRL